MNILILEDETLAYQKLMNCLHTFFNEDIDCHWSRSNEGGEKLLNQNTYDFILSDIQLLDGVSFDLFDKVTINCPIIFCSAYNEYLFEAFKSNGIAYILKPYSQIDFNKALEKYQSLFQQDNYNILNHSEIKFLKLALKEGAESYKKRFTIKKQKGIQLLNVSSISIINASGDFCIAIDDKGQEHIISQNIGAIEKQLNPREFYRINRSEIIHIDYIDKIEYYFKNRLLIKMKTSKEKVITSSSKTSEFRKWLND
jgi:DNA-binding LytR/AlgR family response regulator